MKAWFTLPGGAGTAQPPRWKMAVVTVFWRMAGKHFCSRLLNPLVGYLPHWCKAFYIRGHSDSIDLGSHAGARENFQAVAAPTFIREAIHYEIPDLVLYNGRFPTLVPAMTSGFGRCNRRRTHNRHWLFGEDLLDSATDKTERIDLKGRRVIPGLNDSHMHVIRGGLNYNLELRWDGVPSLADGLRMLKEQAHARRPPMGAGHRRLDGISVRGTAHADARRNQCRGSRYAGLCPASLLPWVC